MRFTRNALFVLSVAFWPLTAKSHDHGHGENLKFDVRSVRDGNWSDAKTWQDGRAPKANDRVLIARGTSVVYDVASPYVVRLVQIVGTLRFAHDRDTELNAALIKVQDSDLCNEGGFACDLNAELQATRQGKLPTLEVGTREMPIPAEHTARIRLHYLEGMNKDDAPALVCCSARMELHGAPLSRTWVKLGETVKKGDKAVSLAEPVTGWRVGDRIIITPSILVPGGLRRTSGSGVATASEKIITAIEGTKITLDGELEEDHAVDGEFQPEVANLSRNVIVESAEPELARGHTMYHRNSAGAISYAEFRHLGKEGVLGRYSLHFHLVGDTMRGAYVLGASIWDSGNRWITIHGTNYLVVRDCVGYISQGHGYYLEDGTEVYNVLDRNLAVQANKAKSLPNQVLPFDRNDAAGFWWANCLNTFTRNVACGNERYGFRYEMRKTSTFDPTLPIEQPDGSSRSVDVRTLPFIRFEDNESHNGRHYGVNIGEGADRVGPDRQHPVVVRNLKIWHEHYTFRPDLPCMLIENLRLHHGTYGFYHPNYDHHVYRNIHVSRLGGFIFKRSNDAQGTPNYGNDVDFSSQYGPLTVDGLTVDDCGSYSTNPGVRAMVGLSDYNPTGEGVCHFRNVKVVNFKGDKHRTFLDRGPWPNPPARKPDQGVPVFLHDYYGPGRHAKLVCTAADGFGADGLAYHEESPLTGNQSRVAEVDNVTFPDNVLDPVDDLPPMTIITGLRRDGDKLLVSGLVHDNGVIASVMVNGEPAACSPQVAGVVEWKIQLPAAGAAKIVAASNDAAGNAEQNGHWLTTGASLSGI